jgi:epoxyqueuosine reductase
MMGNRVFGCDDCQLVCPWNQFAGDNQEQDFKPRHNLDNQQLTDLFLWSEQDYLSKTEGSAIRRIGYARWLRNLAVGLGNADTTPDIIDALQQRLDVDDEMVREHIRWALAQHGINN